MLKNKKYFAKTASLSSPNTLHDETAEHRFETSEFWGVKILG